MKFLIHVLISSNIYLVSTCAVAIDLDETRQSFACTSGDVTANSAIVWFRMEDQGTLTIEYSHSPDLRQHQTLAPVTATDKNDYTIKTKLEKLTANTQYYFRGTVTGKKPGPICQFKTAPKPDDMNDIVFAVSGDTRESHMPFPIMDSIAAMKPDFFLFLGDSIYADYEGAASELEDYWDKYKTIREDKASQRLFSQTSLYMIWDDHEVENNYEVDSPLIPVGRQAFFDYWPIEKNASNPNQLYRSYRWGKAAELFILDTRPYRNRDKGVILGEQQKKWFMNAIAESNAMFKFVATPVPISSGHYDKWGGFMSDRDEILTHVEEIPGVIFLTADVHYAADSSIPGYDESLREIIIGPLGTKPNSKDKSHFKRFEFFYNESYNYALVRVFPNAKPPYVEIEIRDTDNNQLYKTRIEEDG